MAQSDQRPNDHAEPSRRSEPGDHAWMSCRGPFAPVRWPESFGKITMTATWPDDTLHGLLLVEASELWRKSQRRSPWFRLLNWLFRQPVPSTLYMQEYADTDWETGACKGDAVRTWAFDDLGIRDAIPPALGPASHALFERLAFCAPPQGDKVAMTYFYSPFGGFGHILKIVAQNGKPRLKAVKSWIF